MLSALLLSLLLAAPDEYGPLVLDADALYLAHRFVKADRNLAPEDWTQTWATTDEELDQQVCAVLFDDCAREFDEFTRHEALERHRSELLKLRTEAHNYKAVVLSGSLCLGEYDFKKGILPVKSLSLGTAGRREPAPGEQANTFPFGFWPVLNTQPKELRLEAARAAELFRGRFGRCLGARLEVVLPVKPVRWAATVTRKNPITGLSVTSPNSEAPDLPVQLKRIRLIDAEGSTLATF